MGHQSARRCHRHHAANAEAGDAALEADDRLAVGIGGDHGLAKPGQVVAELGRLVDPQIGQRRRRVELKLVDAGVFDAYTPNIRAARSSRAIAS